MQTSENRSRETNPEPSRDGHTTFTLHQARLVARKKVTEDPARYGRGVVPGRMTFEIQSAEEEAAGFRIVFNVTEAVKGNMKSLGQEEFSISRTGTVLSRKVYLSRTRPYLVFAVAGAISLLALLLGALGVFSLGLIGTR